MSFIERRIHRFAPRLYDFLIRQNFFYIIICHTASAYHGTDYKIASLCRSYGRILLDFDEHLHRRLGPQK